ncbi:MAG: hypothetical protein QOE60_1560, partial [Thermoleophilaceae bacterium]|nr:hypothetical protein [Thermoleophilaceae bacterium]
SLPPIRTRVDKRGLAAALLLVGLLVGGCGPAGRDDTGGLALTVTRDFGRGVLDSAHLAKVPDGATALGLARSQSDVPISGPGWSVFVNGLRLESSPAAFELSPGDRVQWDRPSSAQRARARAIVGAFPEPFRHGFRGERRPVRVECDDTDAAPCGDAKQALDDVGVPTSGSSLGAPGTEHVTRLVVAQWPAARIVRGAFTLEDGPERNGIFARFSSDGKTLGLLDQDGAVARTVHAGDGTALIVALRPRAEELVWLVTALDAPGLAAGVRALRGDRLRNAYAVAVTGRTVEKLPL